MSNINSKFLYSEKENNYYSLTPEEENTLQTLLTKKDVEYLIKTKQFYKDQIMDLYDKEREIQKFQQKLQSEISEIQKMLFGKCDHEWIRCSEGGYDESPDYICCICECDYSY